MGFSPWGVDIIRRKIFFSVLLLFSLTIFLNVAVSNAAVVNQIDVHSNSKSVADPALISVSSNIKSNSGADKSLNKTKFLAAGSTVIVSGLNLAQMKDGISRAQKFYKTNGRLPKFVSYGTRQIPIATFKKIIATQGLKIVTTKSTVSITDTSSISALAKSLVVGSPSTYESAVRLFNWVRDNITYSFYYNTKYGAAGTLESRTGNCCDTSNLLVAMARAVGIPARYKSGYCQFTSGKWYGHVWANLYVNGKWYPADAISYRNTFGVINNWNTSNFILKGVYNTLPF